jgi:ribosomal protein L7Ae-like RNA K-turn-binding protein
MDNKLLGMLGLARRAGRLTYGFDAVLKDIAGGKAEVVMLTADAAPRTVKNIEEACKSFGTDVFLVPCDKLALGHAIGRGETAVAAVTDKAFSLKVKEICRNITGGIY